MCLGLLYKEMPAKQRVAEAVEGCTEKSSRLDQKMMLNGMDI